MKRKLCYSLFCILWAFVTPQILIYISPQDYKFYMAMSSVFFGSSGSLAFIIVWTDEIARLGQSK